jgi:DNA-binding XRE family transcriptional regulator
VPQKDHRRHTGRNIGAPSALRLRRLTLGLRQADLADRAGISREQVVRLELKHCEPTWGTAHSVAAALASKPEDLFPPAPNEVVAAGEVGLAELPTPVEGHG